MDHRSRKIDYRLNKISQLWKYGSLNHFLPAFPKPSWCQFALMRCNIVVVWNQRAIWRYQRHIDFPIQLCLFSQRLLWPFNTLAADMLLIRCLKLDAFSGQSRIPVFKQEGVNGFCLTLIARRSSQLIRNHYYGSATLPNWQVHLGSGSANTNGIATSHDVFTVYVFPD